MAELESDPDEWGNDYTVFVLGAGCSKPNGVPVMNEFMDHIYGEFSSSPSKDYRYVFEALSRLRKVNHYSNLNLRNIESVFSALAMYYATNEGGDSNHVLKTLRSMIGRIIDKTSLLKDSQYKQPDNRRTEYPRTESGRSYATLLEHIPPDLLINKQVAFITTNYDILLEVAIVDHDRNANVTKGKISLRPDYCVPLGGEAHVFGVPIKVLKLHGSVNWYRRDGQSALEYIPICRMMKYGRTNDGLYPSILTTGSEKSGYGFTELFQKHGFEAAIIPPSFTKDSTIDQFGSVWKEARKVLSKARRVVFAGYSVPDTDLMFRYLWSAASVENDWIKKVLVINPDEKSFKTYETLLGHISNDGTLKPISKCLGNSMDDIKSFFGMS
jgi:hypothetical protein